MDEDDDDLYGSGPTNGATQASLNVPAIKAEDYEDGEEEGEEIEQDDDSDSVVPPCSDRTRLSSDILPGHRHHHRTKTRHKSRTNTTTITNIPARCTKTRRINTAHLVS